MALNKYCKDCGHIWRVAGRDEFCPRCVPKPPPPPLPVPMPAPAAIAAVPAPTVPINTGYDWEKWAFIAFIALFIVPNAIALAISCIPIAILAGIAKLFEDDRR